MPATTTIKVPVELRDRLAARAAADHVTLAAVIAAALEEVEERRFWTGVREQNASLTSHERELAASDATLLDDLADSDDDEISRHDGW